MISLTNTKQNYKSGSRVTISMPQPLRSSLQLINLMFEEIKGKRKAPGNCNCMADSEVSDLYYAPIDFATARGVKEEKQG